MAYPPHHWEWIHPFQAFRHINSSSAAVRTENGLHIPSLRTDILISQFSLKWVYPFWVMGWVSWWWLDNNNDIEDVDNPNQRNEPPNKPAMRLCWRKKIPHKTITTSTEDLFPDPLGYDLATIKYFEKFFDKNLINVLAQQTS